MPGQWFVVTRQFLAHENEIDLQAAQMPDSMCGQYLSHDFHVTEVANHNDDDRQIPRNALSPERTLTLGAAAETRRRRSELGLWKDNEACQLLKGLHIGPANVEPAHLQLRMGPSGLKSPRASVKLRVAPRQCDNTFTGVCHYRNERELKSLVRQNCDAPAQAEDRIEHGADAAGEVAGERFGIFQRAASAEKLGAI